MTVTTSESLGARLRRLRERADRSVASVAGAAGLDESDVVAIERGDRGLAVAEVDALADALGVHPEELLTAEAPVMPLFRNEGGTPAAEDAVREIRAVMDDFFTFAAAVRR